MNGLSSATQWLNLAAYEAAQKLASPLLYHVMAYVVESYLVVLPLILIYLVYRRDRNVFSFALAAVCLYLIGEVLKLIIHEPRPCSLQGAQYIQAYCDTGYSFPSNHATVLTGLALFINYRYLRILYIIWVLLLLFGKVFLAEHYLTDIIAGVIISLAVSMLFKAYGKQINNAFAGIFNRIFGRIYRL